MGIEPMSACDETFVTLCVYPATREVYDAIGGFSQVPPTSMTERDGVYGWFWSSQRSVSSTDVADHLRYVLELISRAGLDLANLLRLGCKCWVSCFWVSSSGNGGPGLEPDVMAALSALNVPLYFDIYFGDERAD